MENLIEIKNLTKRYKSKNAVNDLTINIKKGEIYGLIGNNGAGKTTLLKMIAGLTVPTSGAIVVSEKGIKTGTLISKPYLYGDMSAADNLKALSVAAGYNIDKSAISETLDMVGLSGVGNKKAGSFSTGMKQRLGLALALIGKPDLLLLDEPINGLDIEGVVDLRNVILKIHKESETTIIVSSHILDELSKIATRICLIKNGKIVVDCSEQEFLEKGGGKSLEESYLKFMAQN